MRNRLAVCKLLLTVPTLFLMLQVSLSLHHHHAYSYHDDQDSFHRVSTDIDKQACSFDGVINHWASFPLYCPLVSETIPLFRHVPVADIATTAPHSRAPPSKHS